MPHIKHPVSNPAHGCALQLHLIGFVLCSKPELKTEQEVRFLNKLLELKIGHGCPIFDLALAANLKQKTVQGCAVFCPYADGRSVLMWPDTPILPYRLPRNYTIGVRDSPGREAGNGVGKRARIVLPINFIFGRGRETPFDSTDGQPFRKRAASKLRQPKPRCDVLRSKTRRGNTRYKW